MEGRSLMARGDVPVLPLPLAADTERGSDTVYESSDLGQTEGLGAALR